MPLITNTVLQETICHVVYCFATCSAMRDTNGDIMTTQGGEQQPLVTEECSGHRVVEHRSWAILNPGKQNTSFCSERTTQLLSAFA